MKKSRLKTNDQGQYICPLCKEPLVDFEMRTHTKDDTPEAITCCPDFEDCENETVYKRIEGKKLFEVLS